MKPRLEKIEWCLAPYTEQGSAACARVQSVVDAALAARRLAARTPSVQIARARAVATLAANIMANGPKGLIVPIGDIERRSQYVNLTRDAFENVLHALEGGGYIKYSRHPKSHRLANEVRPLEPLLELLTGCSRADTALQPDAELVIMKDKLDENGEPLEHSSYVRYNHTEETLAMRDRVRAMNVFLAGEDPATRMLRPRVTHPTRGGNPYARRYFNKGSIEFGGRIFGHWAQSIPKTERELLRIDGSPAAQVDYRSMVVHLLYAREGRAAPQGDVYALEGWPRDGVKRVVSTLLFREKAIDAFPKGTRELFHKRARFRDLEQAIYRRLPVVQAHANTRIGYRLFRAESDCLDHVCAELIRRDIGFVPIHDAVLVPVHEAGTAQVAMWRAFLDVAGVDLHPEVWPQVTSCGVAAGSQLAGGQLLGGSRGVDL
jgi:hypothetical protein